MWNRLRSPSGVKRGKRKQETPASVWARTRKASHIGAEQNHLWPVISYSPPGPPPFSGTALVVLARTSEPPCFSVIAMPARQPGFWSAGRSLPSYWSEVKRGSHSAAISGWLRSDGITEKVIEIGQPTPASTCASWLNRAARATLAPTPGSRQGRACRSCSMPRLIS